MEPTVTSIFGISVGLFCNFMEYLFPAVIPEKSSCPLSITCKPIAVVVKLTEADVLPVRVNNPISAVGITKR